MGLRLGQRRESTSLTLRHPLEKKCSELYFLQDQHDASPPIEHTDASDFFKRAMMAASSAGSYAFVGFAVTLIFLAVLFIVRHFLPLRTTPAYLLLPISLALALPASIILLVPIDLASNAIEEDATARGIWLPERALLVLWRITYWLTFILTWIILPLLGDYADAGQRNTKARVFQALRSSAKYQATVFTLCAVGLVYYILKSGFKPDSIKGLVMALAYAWGLILAVYLMGHGLVAIPRRLYRDASVNGRLHRLYSHAPAIHDKKIEAEDDAHGIEGQVTQLRLRKWGVAKDLQDWIDDLAESADTPEARVAPIASARASSFTLPTTITDRYLAELTRKLKRARHKRIRFESEWAHLCQEAQDLRIIVDAAPSRKLDFGRPATVIPFTKLPFLNSRMRYVLHAKLMPALRIFGAFFLGAASLCIIWSEIARSFLQSKLSVVGLSIIHHPNSESKGKIGFAGQVMAAAWLCYMCTAALMSIREVKVWGNRALVRRNTYAESATWYACQVAKLTVPLSYNFTTFVPDEISHNTMFYSFLGKLIDLTPISNGFSDYFPIFIVVPVLATTFNLYGKIKKLVGFGVLEDESEENPSGFGTGGWREGKTLVERELAGHDNTLGLHTRDHSPRSSGANTPYLDSPAGGSPPRSQRPSLSIDGAQQPQNQGGALPFFTSQSTSAPATRQPLAHRPPQPASVVDQAIEAPPDEEGGFFSDFAHRVRNTFETTDRPDWLPKFTAPKKPKWMGGDAGNLSGGETSGRADAGRGLGRWFGGRPDDGRLRL